MPSGTAPLLTRSHHTFLLPTMLRDTVPATWASFTKLTSMRTVMGQVSCIAARIMLLRRRRKGPVSQIALQRVRRVHVAQTAAPHQRRYSTIRQTQKPLPQAIHRSCLFISLIHLDLLASSTHAPPPTLPKFLSFPSSVTILSSPQPARPISPD